MAQKDYGVVREEVRKSRTSSNTCDYAVVKFERIELHRYTSAPWIDIIRESP